MTERGIQSCGRSCVDIVIVNFNTGDQLRKCIESVLEVAKAFPSIARIVVVDNASSDASAEDLGSDVTVVRNPLNEGFGKACNRGASLGHSEYLLFLNPDTTVECRVLSGLIEFMGAEQNANVGIVGVGLRGDNGHLARSCARFPTRGNIIARSFGLDVIAPGVFPPHFMVEWDHLGRKAVDQVMGACFFVRRALFETLSGFDERFFVYFEDLDFSVRARNAGFLSYFLGDFSIYHKGGGSSSTVKGKRLFYSLRSRILYCQKYFGSRFVPIVVLAIASGELLLRLGRAAARLSFPELSATIEGYSLLSDWLIKSFREDKARRS